ncbi:MAG: uroporphyrinogen decarboxylase [Acidobacteria bacterium]|nr:uroporphyrinogen decarboxylase [Acidobacteriota bacterium]
MSAEGVSEVAGASDRFLRACRREPVDLTPVWFMRQAGRYLPEYRAARADRDVLQMSRIPEMAVEITLQPVRRLGVDAAILYSDIMVPLAATGVEVRMAPGLGPVIDEPIRAPSDLSRLRPLDPDSDIPFVLEAVRMLRRDLTVPLIGFAGGPYTLASYLVEGRPARDHPRTRALMHGDPAVWEGLLDRLAGTVLALLRAQVAAGAQAVQLFDSWVGDLDPGDYERFVLPWVSRIFEELAPLGVPRIHFGVGTGELLALMRAAGADVVGVDWRVPLDRAWDRVGRDAAVQGNLDPAVCLAPWDAVERKALEVLRRADGRPGHVFNLGHGVFPQTPPETLERLVDLVHSRTAR